MRTKLLRCFLVLFMGANVLTSAVEPVPPLRVSIVPSRSIKGQKILRRTSAEHGLLNFDVVLTNVSAVPVTIWEPTCSWGFQCLSFEVVRGGQRRKIERQEIGWDSNWPRPYTIAPQGHYVLHIKFGDSTWPMGWIADALHGNLVTLRATYTIPPLDDLTTKVAPEVWVGSASSVPEEFTIQ